MLELELEPGITYSLQDIKICIALMLLTLLLIGLIGLIGLPLKLQTLYQHLSAESMRT